MNRAGRFALGLLLGSALLGGCGPAVLHPPQVEPGFRHGVTGGVHAVECDSICENVYLPPAGVYGRYGWQLDGPVGPAAMVGVFLPALILLPLAELDLYAQAPLLPNGWAVGAGTLLSTQHQMPYVQLGHTPIGGRGWYVTQGYVWRAREKAAPLFGEQAEGPGARYALTALTVRLKGDVSVYAGGALGREYAYLTEPGRDTRPLRFVMVGVLLENRRPRTPRLPPRPAR